MDFDFAKTEKKILKFWKDKEIFNKLKEKNQGKKHWSFIDGPITANNPMGVHHAWGRTYKDLFHRYKALQGFDARYQSGFDCQGLWVEVEVEKEMGFKTKKDIEKFGVAPFVQACKDRVLKYSKIQTQQSIRLGQWMDWENSYYTMSDENNYAIWGFLKKCKEKGLLYKGRDVVPWCPRCGTAISQHEILTEEYKEIIHKSIFVKLAVKNEKQTFFLVWTTTPWTLPANVALAVNPKLTYVKVEDKKKNIFICLKDKANLVPEGKIIEEFLGQKLEGLEYEAMFDELEAVKNEIKKQDHRVILWKDVVEDEGTGVVHIAPGCGQEDFQLSKENKLTAINPTDSESRYQKGFGFLEGKLVSESADSIFKNLKKKGLVFKIENYRHRYPTCWRCKSELIFRLVDEWYISMDKLRELLIKTTKQINWIPSFGLDRELDWLKNMQDWLISKKRYWGLALPIYECEKCGNFEVIGSKEELKEKAVSGWKKFDGNSPHKPWIDEVKIKCSKCGEVISRIPDVGNPWLDAGIVSFSTMKYYEDKEFWKKWFPADLISESFPGQFKNWFYSLIVMSAVLENTNPTKTVFAYALVRDEKGEEMHKSKGNAIWFDDAIEDIGADPMRWMYSRQNPAYNLNFGYKIVEEIKRKLLTLYNIFAFLDNYVDKKEDMTDSLPETNNILDKWIISCFNTLAHKVSSNLDKYNVSVATL
ncbi:MAG: isoleucine--tRNA ligase, partial [Patescibacteria group bacterium]|nr:isoleucine--tRNA ligase [Patescibacteria group bacterium]